MPVHECTLDAAHGWLLERRESLTTLLRSDPQAHDVRAAAYWLWGARRELVQPRQARPAEAKVAVRGGETGPGIGQGVLSSKIRSRSGSATCE
jgi:hypothetical protein